MVAPLLLAGLGLLGGFAKQKYEKDVALDKQSRQANLLGSLLQPKVEKQSLGTLYDDPTEPPKPFEMRDGLLSQKPEDFRVGMETDDLGRATAGGMLVGGGGMTAPEEIRIRPPEGEQAYEFSTPERTAGTSGIPKEQLDTLVTLAQGGDKFAITQLQTLFQKQAGLGDEGGREKQRRIETQNKKLADLYEKGKETGDYKDMLAQMTVMGGGDKAEFLKGILQPQKFTNDGKFEIIYDDKGIQKELKISPAVEQAERLKQSLKAENFSDSQIKREDEKIGYMATAIQSANTINQMIKDLQDDKIYDSTGLGKIGLLQANLVEMVTREGSEKAKRTASFEQQITTQAQQLLSLQKGTKTDFDFSNAMTEVGNADTKDQRIAQLLNLHARLINNYETSVRQLQQGRSTKGQRNFSEEELQGLTNVLKPLPQQEGSFSDFVQDGQIVPVSEEIIIRKKPNA